MFPALTFVFLPDHYCLKHKPPETVPCYPLARTSISLKIYCPHSRSQAGRYRCEMAVRQRRNEMVLGARGRGADSVFDNPIEVHQNHLANSSSQIPL